MKVYPCIYAACFCLLLFVSCDSSDNKNESRVLSQSEGTAEPLAPAPEFKEIPVAGMPDAMVDIYSPTGNEDFEPGKVLFSVNIRNYPLGKERPFILSLNGATPKAHSTPSFQMELDKGTYRAVTFLLDEQGLALKEYGNFSERYFSVGGAELSEDHLQPSLLLHLPRDQQQFAEGEPILIDFIYLGGDPELDGLAIQVELGDYTLRTQKVEALSLSGIPKGNYDLFIRLLNSETGQPIPGNYTSISRNIRVE
ncbi:hypothetical protein [Cyclobacterium jeungdonense]|uniref:Uncharacterized protein n=1 Tax=Cyclobacterium jeungdonense TaxID=708087 RepID=A0ABT8C9C5_9BACT|nr:hypothetical protein [Cyclobacterium jeungdonense]MDN3688747.1 hypothetical protein [Cyclobacterium jeungdonense]